MKIHRFIGDFSFAEEEIKITDPEVVRQVRLVLRLEVGEQITLGDGKGTEAQIEILSIDKSAITGKILEITKAKESGKTVSLYLAILKKENFELAVQKAVECGVSNIIPVITQRTVKTGLNIERLEKIIKEASEQSGRSKMPQLFGIMNFESALLHGKNSESKTLFHLVDKEYQPDKNTSSVSIFIGPEGGFTEKEIALAQESGHTIASLGDLTLRGETAAIVATYRAVQGI